MLFSMAVTLYTSRVVLEILGFEDYGIYTVVGGVVAMFSFLNSTMSGATSRFLTFELEKCDTDRLNRTFNTALTIHIGIAIAIFILAETVGLWFLETELNIPDDKMFSTRIVYQFSILSSMVVITQVPYNSSIISHERMKIYAYVSMIDVLLKLGIVYLLKLGGFDKLILYAALLFVVIAIIAMVYRVYCIRNFKECKYHFTYDKKIIKPMLSFSGWDLFGNLSVMLRGQGINILQNIYWGPVINASTGIANQVMGALSSFADSFLTAIRPRIIKYYAENKLEEMQILIVNASKYSFLLLLLFAIPLIIENKIILNIWLKNTPDYVVQFCQLNIIICLIIVMFRPILFSIHAVGKLAVMSIFSGVIYTSVLPVTYIFFKNGSSPTVPYLISIVAFCICSLSNLLILRKLIPIFSIANFVHRVCLPCILILLLSLIFPLIIYYNMSDGIYRLVVLVLASSCSVLFLTYLIATDRKLKIKIINRIIYLFNNGKIS